MKWFSSGYRGLNENHRMRAAEILQNSLGAVLTPLHAYRRDALQVAVTALIGGGRLVLMDMARRCEGYQYVKAPLKRLDRLLSNPRLHAERVLFYRGVAHALIRCPHPLIIVDWSPIKDGRDFYLLRAAVPVSGRAITVLESVHPAQQQASPKVEREFLRTLATILPAGTQPILVTDAGFRGPWCDSVTSFGWSWITRLRNRTHVRQTSGNTWTHCKTLYAQATGKPRDMGLYDVAKTSPVTARVIVCRKSARGRHQTTRSGKIARRKTSLAAANREGEPWILLCSPGLALNAKHVVKAYTQRMQIEQTFRDTKSTQFGYAFECSLTRTIARMEILLLLQMLAVFVSWISGLLAIQNDMTNRLNPYRSRRRLYSIVRLGREALVTGWLTDIRLPRRICLPDLLAIGLAVEAE